MTKGKLTFAPRACAIVALAFSWGLTVNSRIQSTFLEFDLPAHFVQAADFSPDENSIALATIRSVVSEDPYKGEYFDELEIWNLRDRKLVVKKLMRTSTFRVRSDVLGGLGATRHVRYSHDGRIIVYFDGAELRLLDGSICHEVRRIGLPLIERKMVANKLEVSPDNVHAALLFGSPTYPGVTVQTYDLTSGGLSREWRFGEMSAWGDSGLAWSPDGTRLAFTWMAALPGDPLPKDALNLVILDTISGGIVNKIHTGYVAGSVVFADNNTVLTVSLNPDEKQFAKDTIKAWDATMGKLLWEIPSPPAGVHNQMQISENRRMLLASVPLERYDSNRHMNEILYQRFQLWRLPSTEPPFTSPDILPIIQGRQPRLRLSPKATYVLVWWSEFLSAPTMVFQVQ